MNLLFSRRRYFLTADTQAGVVLRPADTIRAARARLLQELNKFEHHMFADSHDVSNKGCFGYGSLLSNKTILEIRPDRATIGMLPKVARA